MDKPNEFKTELFKEVVMQIADYHDLKGLVQTPLKPLSHQNSSANIKIFGPPTKRPDTGVQPMQKIVVSPYKPNTLQVGNANQNPYVDKSVKSAPTYSSKVINSSVPKESKQGDMSEGTNDPILLEEINHWLRKDHKKTRSQLPAQDTQKKFP